MTQSCKDIELLLDSYYDKELSISEKAFVENHLANCADCQAKLDLTGRVVQAVQALPKLEMKFDLSERLDELIAQKSVTKKHDNLVSFKSNKLLISAAAGIILLVIAFMASNTHHFSQSIKNNIATNKDNSVNTIAHVKQHLNIKPVISSKSKHIDEPFEIAALTDNSDETLTDALGLATDEDGLYDIKM
jgi:hypothetical protein